MKWSYSDWSLFDTCARKYYHLKVVKDFKQTDGEALLYGRELHEAAENYIRSDTPLPEKFKYLQTGLDALRSIKGQKYCEYKLGLTDRLEPVDFFNKQVWWRGVADLFVENSGTGFLVDYKTGRNSRFADKDQLELLSLALFKHHPQLQTIKGGLFFVVSKDMVKANFQRSDAHELWTKWLSNIQRLERAFENNVWNATPNFSCQKYCPVENCEHYGNATYRR